MPLAGLWCRGDAAQVAPAPRQTLSIEALENLDRQGAASSDHVPVLGSGEEAVGGAVCSFLRLARQRFHGMGQGKAPRRQLHDISQGTSAVKNVAELLRRCSQCLSQFAHRPDVDVGSQHLHSGTLPQKHVPGVVGGVMADQADLRPVQLQPPRTAISLTIAA